MLVVQILLYWLDEEELDNITSFYKPSNNTWTMYTYTFVQTSTVSTCCLLCSHTPLSFHSSKLLPVGEFKDYTDHSGQRGRLALKMFNILNVTSIVVCVYRTIFDKFKFLIHCYFIYTKLYRIKFTAFIRGCHRQPLYCFHLDFRCVTLVRYTYIYIYIYIYNIDLKKSLIIENLYNSNREV